MDFLNPTYSRHQCILVIQLTLFSPSFSGRNENNIGTKSLMNALQCTAVNISQIDTWSSKQRGYIFLKTTAQLAGDLYKSKINKTTKTTLMCIKFYTQKYTQTKTKTELVLNTQYRPRQINTQTQNRMCVLKKTL